MDFIDLVKKRRSTRAFTGEKINEDDIVKLLKSMLLSPSSRHSRPWEFVLVEDPQMLYQLSQCKPTGGSFLKDAALAIVILGNPNISDMWIEDTSITATHLMLQAESLNIGCCWVQIRGRKQDDGTLSSDIVKDLLHIPAHLEVETIMALGHKTKELPPHEDSEIEWLKVHCDVYGSNLK